MIRLSGIIFICLSFCDTAYGQCSSSVIGRNIYTNCLDGSRSVTHKIGNTSYTTGTDSYGGSLNTTTQKIGNTSYTNGTDSYGGSLNMTTQKIGNTSYTTGTDSYGGSLNLTTQKIGNTYYTYP